MSAAAGGDEIQGGVTDVEIRTIGFTPELDRAYRLYAAKTIEDRALPDVRDGCKPVQRRILYAMFDMGLLAERPHRKCARIVGEVLGKYHPHGDQSVYGSLTRMAQPFAMRDVLIDGQGNFGSVDGDAPAAMRYTEARLTPLGELMLQDIDSDTVLFVDNFDSSLQEPSVLPAAVPNLLINGSSGIAVGMATNIPPHNLGEVSDAVAFMVRRWRSRGNVTTAQLMELVPGPDFPTGGVIYRYREQGGEVVDTLGRAYELGRSRIIVQARMHFEPIAGGKTNIVITELPFTVQKSTVIERIAREAKDGRINGLTDLRDESDYDTGMRVVVELSRTATPDVVMADLLKYSQLQETFGCNALALVPDGPDGTLRPRHLSMKEMLEEFITFRLIVVERRARHELEQKRQRLHVLEGLLVAVTNIDEVVQIIRRSKGPDEARGALTARFGLSDIQTQAILDMPLRRLTSLETTRLKEEEKELRARLKVLEALLASEDLRLDAIAEEAADLKSRYATPRRSVILDSEDSASRTRAVTEADLRLPAEPQVVILTPTGLERRDAMGFRYAPTEGLTTRTTTCHLAHTRADPADELLLVSSGGRAWRHAVGFIPDKVLFEQLGLVRGERVVHAAVLPADGATCVVLGTRQGRLKRTRVADLATKPGQWFAVMGMEEGDEVALAGVAGDDAEVLFATSQGLVLVTSCGDVNPQASGSARGVAGIGLRADDRVIAGAVVTRDVAQATAVYVVTEEGFAKRVPLGEYPVKGRGSQGVQTVRITPSTGLVAAVAVGPVAAPLDVLFGDGKRFHLPAADVPDENRYNLGKRIIPVWDADGAIVHAAAL